MSEPVRGIVVAHGELAYALVSAAESISGVTGALRPVSNEGLTPEALESVIDETIRSLSGGTKSPSAPAAILFVDLAGGSCSLAGLAYARQTSRAVCITGVNLPMLVDFVFHRRMPLADLVDRVLRKGRASQMHWHPHAPAPPDRSAEGGGDAASGGGDAVGGDAPTNGGAAPASGFSTTPG